MAWKRKNPNFMDLEEARRIGARPITARLPRWKRAFRILTRWAEEPCTRKEFDKRLRLCRNVYVRIMEVEEIERQRALTNAENWRARARRNKYKNNKRKRTTKPVDTKAKKRRK
jgi:hypothetical protein